MRFSHKKIKLSKPQRSSRKDDLQTFYEILYRKSFDTPKTDISINLAPIIKSHFDNIMNSYFNVERNMPNDQLLPALSGKAVANPTRALGTREGVQAVQVLRLPGGPSRSNGSTGVLTMFGGEKSLFKTVNADEASSFSVGTFHKFIFFDVSKQVGHFFVNPQMVKYTPNSTVYVHIICTTVQGLKEPFVQKFVNKNCVNVGLFDSKYIELDTSLSIGTNLDNKKAIAFAKAILQQSFSPFRRQLLAPLAGVMANHPAWHCALELSASARQSTILNYISAVRVFAAFADMKVVDVFLNISNKCLDPNVFARWLRYRLNNLLVMPDTVMINLNAFAWFYRKLANCSLDQQHPSTRKWVQTLNRRMGDTHPSDALLWHSMKSFLDLIHAFDWKTYASQDVFDAAILSLWGCLRISETVDLDIETTELHSSEDMLKIIVLDAKSASKNEFQHKFCSAFVNNPRYCPILAFKRLTQSVSSGALLRNTTNRQRWVISTLSKKFASFVNFAKSRGVIPGEGKFTWHVFRVSYLNIALTELGVPRYLCKEMAAHNSLSSTQYYQKRTKTLRKIRAAKMTASRFPKKRPKPVPFSQPQASSRKPTNQTPNFGFLFD